MSNPLTREQIVEKLLQSLVSKSVSEKLGSIVNEARDMIKSENFTSHDEFTAKLVILTMVHNACDDFYNKMEERVIKQKGVKSE